jgi:type III pantothenate kinase
VTARHTLLAIDAGNTRIKFGLFDAESLAAPSPLPRNVIAIAADGSERIPLDALRAWANAAAGPLRMTLAAAVNPRALRRVLGGWTDTGWPAIRILEQSALLPMSFDLPNPDHAGMDRLLGGLVARSLRPAGTPACIISAGTATVVDYVNADGVFRGGAILPGLEMSAQALYRFTALLPLIDVGDLKEAVPPPVGRDTVAAMQSGILWSQVGAIREFIRQYRSLHPTPPLVILTGGSANVLGPLLGEETRVELDLPLRGLALAARSLPAACWDA